MVYLQSERTKKIAAVAYFQILSQQLLGRAEKNHENPVRG
jgi:hypothetical protein